jgi:cytochrome c553
MSIFILSNAMRIEWHRRIVVSAIIVCGLFWMAGANAFAQEVGTAAQDAQIKAAEAWAFAVFPPSDPHAATPDPHKVLRVTGSPVRYTQAQFDSLHDLDWFPQDHARAPQIVTAGRGPALACAECHMVGGSGFPATAALAGLPKDYIVEQVAAFRTGERGMRGPTIVHNMVDEARALRSADLIQAADYFSATRFVSRVQVIEAATVPKTYWKDFVLVPDKNLQSEPIGERIIEIPINFDDYAHSDGRAGYIAYVPPGSIERGAVIASKGVGAASACESCHGLKLQGVGIIPPLAGLSPTYMARQLILFREGKRTNPQAMPMMQEVATLTINDMIDAAAYAATRKP